MFRLLDALLGKNCFLFLWACFSRQFGTALLKEVKQVLFSQELKSKHRVSEQDFVRNRKLPFHLVVLFIANFLKGSLQDELDQFFQSIFRLDVATHHVCRSAFSKARRKLSHTVFIDLLAVVCRFVDKNANNLETFKGMRVFAIDGSTFKLDKRDELFEAFGGNNTSTNRTPLARIFVLHDVFNRITYHALFKPYPMGESRLAAQHISECDLPEESLILLDRGYSQYGLVKDIVEKGAHFCVRLKSDFKIYRDFKGSGEAERLVQLKTPKNIGPARRKQGLPVGSIPVRLIRYKVNATEYILMTSLRDSSKFSGQDLADLYHQRWEVEEFYKTQKCRMMIEEVSGNTPEIVQQDFHAKVFSKSLLCALALDVKEEIERKKPNQLRRYKLCLAQALAKMKNSLVLLFLRSNPRKVLDALCDIWEKCKVAIVKGRSFPRQKPDTNYPKRQQHRTHYAYNR